ncbi:MAG: hypothetical protein WAU91_15665, partial [Desulfatitalea sp.]
MKAVRRFSLILLILLVAGAAGVWIDLFRFTHRPAGTDDTPVVIAVAPGETFDHLAATLAQQNIITSQQR